VRERAIYLSPWRIDLTIRDGVGALPIRISRLARAACAALDATGAPSPASIGLILTDDAELAELNRTHMAAEGPTDVLSFPLRPPTAFPPHEGGPSPSAAPHAEAAFATPPGRRLNLGDVVISVERAREQADAGHGGQTGDVRWSAADELRLLVTHGVLHVCGWDHADPAEEAAMRDLEQRLLSS
jgi:probable rRNA maturation factor